MVGIVLCNILLLVHCFLGCRCILGVRLVCVFECIPIVRVNKQGRSPSSLSLQYGAPILQILLLSYVVEGGSCGVCVFRLDIGIRVVIGIS